MSVSSATGATAPRRGCESAGSAGSGGDVYRPIAGRRAGRTRTASADSALDPGGGRGDDRAVPPAGGAAEGGHGRVSPVELRLRRARGWGGGSGRAGKSKKFFEEHLHEKLVFRRA